MGAPGDDVVTYRPRRLRILAVVMSVLLCGAVIVGWRALPASLRQAFSLSQILTLLGLLAVLEFVMVAMAASYVRSDASGLRFRNGLRSYAVAWERVHKIVLRPGDPWALVLLKPADGHPFEVDLDAEKRQLMGIQAADGEAARQAIEALRQRRRGAVG